VIEPADSGLPKRSAVTVNQIRSVDRSRLQKKVGRLSRQTMERVDEAIKIGLWLVEL
jgi:mRNA-degrading endonuclease toxin of MazEF toxin-antitoxin module